MMALRTGRYDVGGPRVRPLGLLLGAVVLAACSAASGPPGSPSLEPASPAPSTSPAGGGTIYTGTLGSDAIEGGCVYLQTADGQRLEVIYPDGWTVRRAPAALIDPSGAVVAGPGDEVTIRGDEATDMVSICQLGPIIQATEVISQGGP